jgi:trimethylamine--corrinoid protein Co-methyltransferase
VTKIVDEQTGEARNTVKADAEAAALVLEALPHYSWVSACVSISDAPAGLDDLAELHAILGQTTKPILYWAHGVDNLSLEFEMFAAVAGGQDSFARKPFAINLICPIDPLVHTDEGLSQLMFMAEHNAPLTYIAGAAFGLSGPMTIAGSIAVSLADTLTGLLITQLVRPGAPFIAAKFNDNLDMNTSSVAFSRPEQMGAQMATADVFRYLKLPFCANYGATDSGRLDQQAVFDKSLQLYSALLSGANMVFGSGSFETGMLLRLSDLVFTNEAVGFMKAAQAPILINDETLAEEVIGEVGPGGIFLDTEHTIAHMREFWFPGIFAPQKLETPLPEDGRSKLEHDLDARVAEIIAAGPRSPLPSAVQQTLDNIMEKAKAQRGADPHV